MTNNYNGQVIQISRGNLISRLKGATGKPAKALAFGELFIHTGAKQDVKSYKIHDLVTNSTIQTIFTGDLFAGRNNTSEVYFLGSGGSLKWGGIVFSANNYAELVAQAKQNPEHLFMYNGATSIEATGPSLYDPKHNPEDSLLVNQRKSIADGDTDPNQIGQLDRSYVASSSSEWQNRVNPGDILFYSSVLDQVVVIHLSRSTDALTKINVDALISDSMRLWLQESDAASSGSSTDPTNYSKTPSTLKTLLDGPIRHYQYLVDQKGWKAATILKDCEIIRPTAEATTTKETVTPGQIRLENPHDGEIYYVPFSDTNTGYNKYTVVQKVEGDGVLLVNVEVKEGDLLFALPQADGGVKFAVVSLYGAILDKFKFDKEIERADSYATDIWKIGIAGEYVGDHAYQVMHDDISDFIDLLFRTKVDIDPTTGKIISSQLPDFLLGAPKYMGHFENPLSDWEKLTAETTAETFAKDFLVAADWENLDKSEDDADGTSSENVTGSDKINNLLKTGCYWIYQGETVDISKYPGIFHTCADKDDFASGDVEATLTEEISNLQEEIDDLAIDIQEKKDLLAKLTAKGTALESISSLLAKYKGGTITLSNFRASVETAAAAEGISYTIVSEDTPEETAITIIDENEQDIAIAITSNSDAISGCQGDLTRLQETSAGLIDELNEKTTELNQLKTKIKQHLLNKGDWVIYNAKVDDGIGDDNVGKFEIIDNSSSFIGILVKDTKVAGVAEFKNSEKSLAYTGAWKTSNSGRIEDRRLQKSNDIDISAANDVITFQNEDKVFAAGPDFLDAGFLPRIANERVGKGNATLINSRFILLDETAQEKYKVGLGVNFPTGYKDTKDKPESTKLFWHYAIPEERWKNNHEVSLEYFTFMDRYNYIVKGDTVESSYIVSTKTRTDVDANGVVTATGLNFDWIPFMGTVLDGTQFYSFAIEHEVNPQVYLPSHSGVLATEKYVNQGFTVVKTIFNDLYEKLLRMTTKGHVDWLQTIREYVEEEYVDPTDPSKGTREVVRHEICDSRVLQERSADSFVLKLFYENEDIADPYMEYNKAKYCQKISSYRTITKAQANNINLTIDYVLGADGEDQVILNPSTPQVGDLQPEQMLPNHSGQLLNNNSVIDGGEW